MVPRILSTCLLSALAVGAVSLPQAPVHAQQTATGTITGRVLNAADGKYVPRARVSIAGTEVETYTDDHGNFTLRDVPAGQITLNANFTGQETLTTTVQLSPGQQVEQEIVFNESKGTRRDDGTIVLDAMTVNASRFKTAMEIANNEERTSVNIKNVVSTDAFGDIPSGNVGEFVKFMPGVQVDFGSFNGNNQGYNPDEASGVSIRGFGPEDTAILVDGLPVASATPGNLSRQVALDQLSINNASRIEVIKVPTPDMPANSHGGQVNLITKSAFEYVKPQYTARVFFVVNSQSGSLKKTPGPVSGETYKITPGAEFTVTTPISKTFGISVTGFADRQANQWYRAAPVWNNSHATNYQSGAFTNAAGQASSTANPILTRYQVTDAGSITERMSGNIRVDWRPTPNQLLRANVQYSTYESIESQRRLDFRPTIAAGADWGPDYVVGTTANSNTAMTVTTRDRIGDTISAQLQYNLTLWGWRLSAAGSRSESTSEFKDEQNGHFSEIALNLNPGRVELRNLNDGKAGTALTYWRTNAGAQANTIKDYTQLSNWTFDGTTAKSGEATNKSTKTVLKIDLERDLDFLPFLKGNPMAIKLGGRRDEEGEKKWGRGTGYREILRPGASYAVLDVLDDEYVGQGPGFGLPAQQWASTYKLFEIEAENDIFYVPDFNEATNTRVENYISYVNQQKSITETTDGMYGMLSGRLFRNRLAFVGGARQETKKREGTGPYTDPKWNYVKRPDGSLWRSDLYPNGVTTNAANSVLFANNAAGTALRQSLASEGIAFPTTPYGPVSGANQDFEAKKLQLIPNRYVKQKVKGDPSYSFSVAYDLTKKIVLKGGWSRTFGMPNLESGTNGLISGNNQFTIEEYTETQQQQNQGALGQIRVANPGLRPSSSNNFDLELAYYTDAGGKFSVSWFHKTVTNQTMDFTTYSGTPVFNTVVSGLGLDPADFEDWRVVTATNSKDKQKTTGFEFEVRQDFGFIGGWGRYFQAFATYTLNDLPEPSAPEPYQFTTPDGTIVNLIPNVSRIVRRANRFGSAGIQFASRRLIAQMRGTYRNENERADRQLPLINGNTLRVFEAAYAQVDLSVTYMLNEKFSLFVSGRDIFSGRKKLIMRDDAGLLPEYARLVDLNESGVDWTFGVNARF
jgi:iron complex outermembrane recepter protein